MAWQPGEGAAPECDTPFLNKCLILSLTYHRVHKIKIKKKKKRQQLYKNILIWSSPHVQSPADAAVKQKKKKRSLKGSFFFFFSGHPVAGTAENKCQKPFPAEKAEVTPRIPRAPTSKYCIFQTPTVFAPHLLNISITMRTTVLSSNLNFNLCLFILFFFKS